MEIVSFLNENFWKDSDYFLLMIISIVFILINRKVEIRGKRMAIYTIFILLFVIWNPIIARMGLRFFGEDKYAFMRIYYLIPLMSLIAYGGTEAYTTYVAKHDSGKRKFVFAVIICLTVALSGGLYENTMYRKATNIYKIDQNALEISDMINDDCDKKQVTIYAPSVTDIHYGIRQYAGNIVIAGDSATVADKEMLKNIVAEKAPDYIVITEESDLSDFIMEDDFQWLGESGEYIVYKWADSKT